jgi:hypothetical protein
MLAPAGLMGLTGAELSRGLELGRERLPRDFVIVKSPHTRSP